MFKINNKIFVIVKILISFFSINPVSLFIIPDATPVPSKHRVGTE